MMYAFGFCHVVMSSNLYQKSPDESTSLVAEQERKPGTCVFYPRALSAGPFLPPPGYGYSY